MPADDDAADDADGRLQLLDGPLTRRPAAHPTFFGTRPGFPWEPGTYVANIDHCGSCCEAMILNFLRKRVVGLDVGHGSVKALVLERRGGADFVVGRGMSRIESNLDPRQFPQAIHTALAAAGAESDPVIAAVGGPEIVIRQVSLPPLPPAKIIPALEIQHRELGLLPPGESVMDAQVLRPSKDGTSRDVLSISVPRALVDERTRILQSASVRVLALDVEPLALLNAGIYLTGLEPGELLVLLNVGRRSSCLCLFSEQGPVVARYLDVGAESFSEQLRIAFGPAASATDTFWRAIPPADLQRAQLACRDLVERIAEDMRLSLTFYRTEYDRESLPRYAIGGWTDLAPLGRWLADRIGLTAPLEVMDPFKAVQVKLRSDVPLPESPTAGPQYFQAFGLALRGM
jgi:type IV pilus assembly protein PilM